MNPTNAAARIANEAAHAVATTTDHTLHAGRHAALDALDSLRIHSRQMRNALLDTRDGTLRYIRHEPAAAIMIAAATGLVLLGLAAFLSRRRRRD
jgi:LPXTG-motif cell wall-anchored protein